MTLRLDHLAVAAVTLEGGVAAVEEALEVRLAGGGQHPHMATHNRLLGLGDIYLEVIATDPAAPRPAWPRWFDLDRFAGRPRLTNWICACDDLEAALAGAPSGVGVPVDLQRGDYRWRMAVPADGRLPFDGCFPALIQWQGARHPARALPESGIRLALLEIAHPQAEALEQALSGRFHDPRVVFCRGPDKAMRAVFATPWGERVLT
jgi:hypothetical protein